MKVQPRKNLSTDKARENRLKMTPEGRLLWSRLRRRQLLGHKFRREHPIGPYVVDFFCHGAKLAVEVDGPVHGLNAQVDSDRRRDAYLQRAGVCVLRFTNEQIKRDLEFVLARIAEAVLNRLGERPRL